MSSFYTSAYQWGNQMFLRGYEDGERIHRKVKYEPYLFLNSETPTGHVTLGGQHVYKRMFGNIKEAKNFIEMNTDVIGQTMHGMSKFIYPFLNDYFPGKMEYDPSLIRILQLDIENAPLDDEEHHHTTPDVAGQQVTAISCKINNKIVSFGFQDFDDSQLRNVTYVRCRDEMDLLTKFVRFYSLADPDIITGWNVEFYDVPYLVNRIRQILGEETVKRLSPWGNVYEKRVDMGNRTSQTYQLQGVEIVDYLRLYKKFTYTEQENYKLETIANVELGEGKLDYSEYENLTDLYRRNFQKYMEYNIHDVELIDRLEARLGLLKLGMALVYESKITYQDMFTSIQLWDTIIHNFLMDRNIVVPFKQEAEAKKEKFDGAYVRDPIPGMYKWIATFDVSSLYPSIIIHNNMSPETYLGMVPKTQMPSIDELLDKKLAEDIRQGLIDRNIALAANGSMWDRSRKGLFPQIVEAMYADRAHYRNLMQEAELVYEANKTDANHDKMSTYDRLQHVKKIVLNSLFGAVGNPYFRYYQLQFAEGITGHGKFGIQWVANDINKYLNKVLSTTAVNYVIYIDTDSVFINMEDLVKRVLPDCDDDQKMAAFCKDACSTQIEKIIEKSFERLTEYTNSYVNQLKMKREIIARRAIFLKKKKYIMHMIYKEKNHYEHAKMYIKGIEAVRSDTPTVCRDKIKKALDIMVAGNNDQLIQLIDDFHDEFQKLPVADIACPTGLKNLEKYENDAFLYVSGTPIHAKASLVYNQFLVDKGLTNKYNLINEGDKIKYIYLTEPNPANNKVVAVADDKLPVEFDLDKYVDRKTQFQKVFLNAIERFCDVMDWETEHHSSLANMF